MRGAGFAPLASFGVGEITGRLTGSGHAAWNLAGVKAGTYFIRLSGEASSEVAKVIVTK